MTQVPKNIPKKTPTPVRVDWLDSVNQPGWQYIGPDDKLDCSLRPPMVTRGVLIAVDDASLTVAPTIAPRGPQDLKTGYLDILTIPLGCVVSVRVIP